MADFAAQTTFPPTTVTNDLIAPLTTEPTTVTNDIAPQTTFPTLTDSIITSIDIHSDRPSTLVSSEGGFSIETQTSLSTTSTVPAGGPISNSTSTGTIASITPTPSPSTPAGGDASQIGASFGLMGLMMLAWMGFFSFTY
ncbi:hypothetical protein B0O99DRAFT_617872 [Bisporella sp. PMI_857]|nr:hypothetical protein B0O99DRAFT_617872 [Bisporella sp. PMI_857]